MLALVFKKCKRSLRAKLCNKGYFKFDDYSNCQKPSLLLREELQIPWEPGSRTSYCKGYPKFFWGIASCQNKLCSFLRRMILIWMTNYRMQRNGTFIIIPMRTGYTLSSFFFWTWSSLDSDWKTLAGGTLMCPSVCPLLPPADHQFVSLPLTAHGQSTECKQEWLAKCWVCILRAEASVLGAGSVRWGATWLWVLGWPGADPLWLLTLGGYKTSCFSFWTQGWRTRRPLLLKVGKSTLNSLTLLYLIPQRSPSPHLRRHLPPPPIAMATLSPLPSSPPPEDSHTVLTSALFWLIPSSRSPIPAWQSWNPWHEIKDLLWTIKDCFDNFLSPNTHLPNALFFRREAVLFHIFVPAYPTSPLMPCSPSLL